MKIKFNEITQEYNLTHYGSLLASHPDYNNICVIREEMLDEIKKIKKEFKEEI